MKNTEKLTEINVVLTSYLNIYKNKMPTIDEVAEHCKINRTRTYRYLIKLEKLGLIKRNKRTRIKISNGVYYYRCYICKQHKQIKEYYKNKNKKHGIGSTCKDCTREYEASDNIKLYKHNYYINNKEEIIYKNKTYLQNRSQEKIKEARIKKNIRTREWKKRNNEKISAIESFRGIKAKEIPCELLELKIMQLRLKRRIKQIEEKKNGKETVSR